MKQPLRLYRLLAVSRGRQVLADDFRLRIGDIDVAEAEHAASQRIESLEKSIAAIEQERKDP